MINSMLVEATLNAFKEILTENNVPFVVWEGEEYEHFRNLWDKAEVSEKALAMRQARPAARRLAEKEKFLFLKDGEPVRIRLNYLKRKLNKDSFGEMLFERPDKDWRFTISIKKDANVLAAMPVADRDTDSYHHHIVSVFNEIDDFGDRIFGVPCSNDYFNDVNTILNKIAPLDRKTWARLLSDEEFAYKEVITPMLKAIGDEVPRICMYHPEAPKKLIEYFYGVIDYYFIDPIDEIKVTRIGSVNAHGDLGRIPNNHNYMTTRVNFPTQLLDVRFATGKFGEISRDTIQFSFDGGWAICLKLRIAHSEENGSNFALNAYLPVTPFGSYRDQVEWDPEA